MQVNSDYWDSRGDPNLQTSIDPLDPINLGLVAFWPLCDGKGNVVRDLCQFGKNIGTMNNFGAYPWMPAVGGAGGSGLHGGQSLSFNGTNSYINFPYNPQLNLTTVGMTISVWIFRPSVNDRVIVGKPFTTTNISTFWDWGLQYQGGTGILFWTNGFSTGFNAGAANNWEHWTASTDGVNQKLYLNGKLVKSNPLATLPTNTNSQGVLIGADASLIEVWSGKIKCIRIYNRALTAMEVNRIFYDQWAGLLDYDTQDFRTVAAGIARRRYAFGEII